VLDDHRLGTGRIVPTQPQACLEPLLDGDLPAQPLAKRGIVRAELLGDRLLAAGASLVPLGEEVVKAFVLRGIELGGIRVVAHGRRP
jgi:hypothetical protein